MRDISLPNEMMLDSSGKEMLRKCISHLSTGPLLKDLANNDWTTTRAELCEAEAFIQEMQFFRDRHPSEYQQLCDAIGEKNDLGFFNSNSLAVLT